MTAKLRSAVIVIVMVLGGVLVACTPQAALVSALIPAGTLNTLLGNLERVADENRRQIVELERTGRWHEMAAVADRNLVKDPANTDWWLVAGYARSQSGDHRAAAKAYSEAVRLEPDSTLGWNLLAESYRALGEPERAVNVLNNALLALRDAPVTAFLLGESYSDLGRFTEAAAAYRQAITMQPEFPAAWAGLARAYERLGRHEEARQARARLEALTRARR